MFIEFTYGFLLKTATFGTEAKKPVMLKWLNRLKMITLKNENLLFLDNFDDFKLNWKRQFLKCWIVAFPKDCFKRCKISKKNNGEHQCYDSRYDEKLLKYKIIFKKLISKKVLSYLRQNNY